MKLSSDSSRVAIFEAPASEPISDEVSSGDSVYYYDIGDFRYRVMFFQERGTTVSFGIFRALGDPDQQAAAWSRLLKRNVSLDEAAAFLRDPMRAPYNVRYGVTGEGNAYKIFGAVISAVRDFHEKYPLEDCIKFTGDKEHQSLYRALLRRYERYFEVVEDKSIQYDPGTAYFKICFNEVS